MPETDDTGRTDDEVDLSDIAIMENFFDEHQMEVINDAMEAIERAKDTEWLNAFAIDIDDMSQRFPRSKDAPNMRWKESSCNHARNA